MKRTVSVILSVICVLGLCACSSNKETEVHTEKETETIGEIETEIIYDTPEGPVSRTDIPAFEGEGSELAYMAEGINAMGLKLLDDMHCDDKNTFISPASIYLCYSMLYGGAENKCKEALQNYFGFDGDTVAQLESAGRLMQYLVTPKNSGYMNIANSMWISDKFGDKIKEDYLNALNQKMYSDAYLRNFGDKGTLSEINDWIAHNTNDMIKNAMGDLNPDSVMLLINTVLFKGEWSGKFDAANNYEGIFYNTQGEKNVTYMYQKDIYPYYADDNYQAVRIPYSGGNSAMVIILPKEGVTGRPFESFEDVNARLDTSLRSLRLSLPKTDITCGEDSRFIDVLKNSELSCIFDSNNIDFTKILDTSVYVSDTIHRTALKINEAGTEAAAATIIDMAKCTATPEEEDPETMNINRPFYCAIIDNDTKAVTFCGYIVDPTK